MPDAAKSIPARPRNSSGVTRHVIDVIGEIGERVADRRQFPVEHADDPRLGLVKHQIVHAVVAVDDRRRALRRHVRRQPVDQPVHRRDRLGLRGAVLPAPARDLAAHVVAGTAEIAEPDRLVIDRVQGGDDRVHRIRTSRRARPGRRSPAGAGPRRCGRRDIPSHRRRCRSPRRPRTARGPAAPAPASRPSARMTRNSRSTACALGSSGPGGLRRSTYRPEAASSR